MFKYFDILRITYALLKTSRVVEKPQQILTDQIQVGEAIMRVTLVQVSFPPITSIRAGGDKRPLKILLSEPTHTA